MALPPLGWYEEDPSWLGVPFFTMDHVDGQVPPDNLPYTMEGWVLEATPDRAGAHVVERPGGHGPGAPSDWRSLGVGWLDRPATREARARPAAGLLPRVPRLVGQGPPAADHRGGVGLVGGEPPDEDGEVVLCWGDSRLGNIIWQEFRPAAVVDWEMATLGQPELDLGWWLYFDRQFSEGLGVPRPPGFPSHEETVARYSELLGRPMRDLDYYQVFSGFRFAVILCRLADLMIESGQWPADTDMGTNNLATQFTAQLLGRSSPAG